MRPAKLIVVKQTGSDQAGAGFFKRSGGVLCQGVHVRYQIIERCRAAFPVRLMCRSLQVSASGYYDWRERESSPRDKANDQLLCHSRRLHTDSDGVLGAPRVWEELQYAGIPCSKNRVARLMHINKHQGVPQKTRWRKKASGSHPVGIQNHLARDFSASVNRTNRSR